MGAGASSFVEAADDKEIEMPDAPEHLKALASRLSQAHGVAEALPLPDGSVDAVVCPLTLCSVPNQELALAEIRRVLRPGGTYLFWEHVLSRDDIGLALQQRLLTPLQTIVADGCHLDRQTGTLIRRAGFQDVPMEYVSLDASLISPTVYGRCLA